MGCFRFKQQHFSSCRYVQFQINNREAYSNAIRRKKRLHYRICHENYRITITNLGRKQKSSFKVIKEKTKEKINSSLGSKVMQLVQLSETYKLCLNSQQLESVGKLQSFSCMQQDVLYIEVKSTCKRLSASLQQFFNLQMQFILFFLFNT